MTRSRGTRPPKASRLEAADDIEAARSADDGGRRLRVLSMLDHPHILRVRVQEASRRGEDGGAEVPVFEDLLGGDLDALLDRRGALAPGEAVTVLAPLVDAVRSAHRTGIVHGALTAAAVSFDGHGRPVLCGWDRADIATADGEAEDWRCFGALVDLMLGETVAEQAGELMVQPLGFGARDESGAFRMLGDRDAAISPSDVASSFERRLFAIARPLPVLLDGPAGPAPAAHPQITAVPTGRDGLFVGRRSSLRGSSEDRWARPSGSLVGFARAGAPVGEVLHRPGEVLRVLLRRQQPVRSGRSVHAAAATAALGAGAGIDDGRKTSGEHRRRVRRRRRGLALYGVSLGLAGTVLLVAMLPSEDPQTARSAEAYPTASARPAASSPSPTQTQSATQPSPTVEPGGPGRSGADEDAAVIVGDDPLAAGRLLLAQRAECLLGAAPGCLDAVDERGSSIDAADRELIASGAPVPVIDPASVELTDVQGDAAILSAAVVPEGTSPPGTATRTTERQPVTILVMRSGTGWRLREVFSA